MTSLIIWIEYPIENRFDTIGKIDDTNHNPVPGWHLAAYQPSAFLSSNLKIYQKQSQRIFLVVVRRILKEDKRNPKLAASGVVYQHFPLIYSLASLDHSYYPIGYYSIVNTK